MNEKPISITEFRKNTKVFLNASVTKDVWLRRGDDLYRLQYMGTVFSPTVETPATKVQLPTGVPEKTPVPQKYDEPKPSVDDLIKQTPSYDPVVAERQIAGEQSCCLNEQRPCKHWVWDAQTGEGYRNVLSGRYKEAE